MRICTLRQYTLEKLIDLCYNIKPTSEHHPLPYLPGTCWIHTIFYTLGEIRVTLSSLRRPDNSNGFCILALPVPTFFPVARAALNHVHLARQLLILASSVSCTMERCVVRASTTRPQRSPHPQSAGLRSNQAPCLSNLLRHAGSNCIRPGMRLSSPPFSSPFYDPGHSTLPLSQRALEARVKDDTIQNDN